MHVDTDSFLPNLRLKVNLVLFYSFSSLFLLELDLHASSIQDRIQDFTKQALLRSDIDAYTRGVYKPGTSDLSLLTITMVSFFLHFIIKQTDMAF